MKKKMKKKKKKKKKREKSLRQFFVLQDSNLRLSKVEGREREREREGEGESHGLPAEQTV